MGRVFARKHGPLIDMWPFMWSSIQRQHSKKCFYLPNCTVKWVQYTILTNMLKRFWYNQGLLRSFPDFDVVKAREQHVCPCSHAVFSLADTCCHLCKNESVFQLPTLVVSVYFYEHRPSVWLRLVLCWPCSYSAESQGTLTLTFLSFDVNWCQWKIPQALMWLTLLL